jgi:hypothetical protein
MSVHKDCNLVTIGDSNGSLDIWDLRFQRVETHPPQKIHIDSELVTAGKFIPGKNSIAAQSLHNLYTINYI